jgi:hypothetical protein
MTDKTEAVAQEARRTAPGETLDLFKDGYLSIAETIDALEAVFSDPSPAEISTFNDTMPSSLNDACRRLDLAQEEIMKLRAQVDSAAAWLDQEITRAADQQRQSYARSGEHGQRQGERWHARQIALYEAKLKLTSTGGQK